MFVLLEMNLRISSARINVTVSAIVSSAVVILTCAVLTLTADFLSGTRMHLFTGHLQGVFLIEISLQKTSSHWCLTIPLEDV